MDNDCNKDYHDFSMRFNNIARNNHFTLSEYFVAISKSGDDYLNLCTFGSEIEVLTNEGFLMEVSNACDHIVNICRFPKLYLKEICEVLPVDIVKKIGHEAIQNLASHSEYWKTIKVSGLVPERLLARSLEDEYAIYENRVTKTLVDKLLLKLERN